MWEEVLVDRAKEDGLSWAMGAHQEVLMVLGRLYVLMEVRNWT